MSLSATYEDILGPTPPYSLDDYKYDPQSPPAVLNKSANNKRNNKKKNKKNNRLVITENDKNAEISLCYQCCYKNTLLPVVFGAKTMDTLHDDSNQLYSQILNTMKIKFIYDNNVCVYQRVIDYMLNELDTVFDKKYTSFNPKYMEYIKIFYHRSNYRRHF